MTWWTTLLPVITLILGAGLNEFAAGRRESRAWTRADQERALARQETLAGRREVFELETLTKVLTGLGDLGRAAGRAHHADAMQAKVSGSYASHQLPEGVSDAFHFASRHLHELEGLILDDSLRTQISAAHAAIFQPSLQFNSDSVHAERMFDEAAMLLFAAQEAVAARIREIYG